MATMTKGIILVCAFALMVASSQPVQAITNPEFSLDTTAEWSAAILGEMITPVDSWTDYRMEELFPGESGLFVEPSLYAADDNLEVEFLPGLEGEEEIFGISWNYPEDPNMKKKKILLREAEIEKLKEFYLILTDINSKTKRAKILADDSGKKIDVDFPAEATKKSDVIVTNGTCEELMIEEGFDVMKVKEGKGGIHTATKKTKKEVLNTVKYGELSVIPEPGTLSLLAIGVLALVRRRR